MTVRATPCGLKVAVTDRDAFMVTVQVVLATVSQPLQPAKVEPAAACAVRVTTVPVEYDAEHVAPQLIRGGVSEEVTVPWPVPARTTERVARVPGWKVPSPLPNSTVTVPELRLATARSRMPSPSKSPTTTDSGSVPPAGNATACTNPPPPPTSTTPAAAPPLATATRRRMP